LRLKGITDRVTVADILLLVTLLIFSVGSVAFVKHVLPAGNNVLVEVEGKNVYRLPLDQDTVRHLDGRDGEAVLEIKDHKVRISESTCRNKICVRQGWVTAGVIVCLPNRIVVKVGTEGTGREKLDAISG